MTQANLFGTFNWNSANLSTQVTNDPGQGIYVAPPTPAITTATVAGTITPSSLIGGPYSLGGTFNGAPYYQSGSGFIWFFPGGPYWVLSVSLGDAVNCFAISSGASLPPSGNYTQNGGVTGTAAITVTTVGTAGASGAWVRQYVGSVYLAWWGVLADGATDNSAALNNWNAWARTQTGVTVICPPGQINYNLFSCSGAFYGLPKLELYGYGTTWQNTSSTSGYQWPFFYAANPNFHTGGFLIATTAVGAFSVTCLTPAQAGNFVVGSAAVVMSLDLQYLGYPPCCDQLDFVIVTATNTSTGVVTFANDFLRNIHRADFADGSNSPACGKARIWLLDSVQNSDSRGPLPCPWNVHHTYRGITIPQCSVSGGATYAQQCGRSIKLIDCVLPGVSPTQVNYACFERCEFTAQCEIDKLNNVVEFIDCDRSWNVINNVQTSSVNLIKLTGCTFAEYQAGNAKHTIIDSCNIEAFNDGWYQYGCPRDVVIINSRIASYPQPPMLSNLTNYNLTVDGVNSIYANGIFTILNGGAAPNAPFLWNTIIGSEIVLGQTSVGHPGDKGVGFVTAIADVGSGATAALQITTTLPYANLAAASWAAGNVYIKRRGRVFVYGSSGCDVINNLNDSTLKGFQAGEYWRALLFGVTGTSMNPPYIGELIELDVNVMQATAISSAALIMTSFGAVTIPALTGGVAYTITIDLTATGQRTFNLAVLTGKTTNDSVVLNSVAQSALPAVWCPVNSPLGMRINYTPSSFTPNLLPVVEVIMKFSTGITGKLVPLLETAGIVGQIP